MKISSALRGLLYGGLNGTVKLDYGITVTYYERGDYWIVKQNGVRIALSDLQEDITSTLDRLMKEASEKTA